MFFKKKDNHSIEDFFKKHDELSKYEELNRDMFKKRKTFKRRETTPRDTIPQDITPEGEPSKYSILEIFYNLVDAYTGVIKPERSFIGSFIRILGRFFYELFTEALYFIKYLFGAALSVTKFVVVIILGFIAIGVLDYFGSKHASSEPTFLEKNVVFLVLFVFLYMGYCIYISIKSSGKLNLGKKDVVVAPSFEMIHSLSYRDDKLILRARVGFIMYALFFVGIALLFREEWPLGLLLIAGFIIKSVFATHQCVLDRRYNRCWYGPDSENERDIEKCYFCSHTLKLSDFSEIYLGWEEKCWNDSYYDDLYSIWLTGNTTPMLILKSRNKAYILNTASKIGEFLGIELPDDVKAMIK